MRKIIAFIASSLRYKLAFFLLLFSLGPLAVISAITLSSILGQLSDFSVRLLEAETALRSDVVGKNLTGAAVDTATDIDSYLLERIEDIRRWSEDDLIIEAARQGTTAARQQGLADLISDPKVVQEKLQGSLFVPIESETFSRALSYIFLQTERAETPFVEILVTEASGINVLITRPIEGVSHAAEGWWQSAVAPNLAGIGITEVALDAATQLPVVGIALPIIDRDKKEIVGVIRALVQLRDLQRRISLKAISVSADIQVIAREGLVIVETRSNHAPERVLNPSANLLQANYAPAQMALSAKAGSAGAGFTIVQETEGSLIVGYALTSSSEFYDDPAALSGFAGFNWGVLVAQPEQRALQVLSHLIETGSAFARLPGQLGKFFILITIIVAIAALGGALLLSGSITNPLVALNRSSRRVQEGDLTAQITVGSRDEVGELGKAFNLMVEGLRQRERERDIFGRVVSPEVREKLLSGKLELGGELRWVSVLFSDIRDFSTMSEKMPPDEVVSFLNEYLSEMSQAILPWGGYINNFIGDAIVAIYGAPLDQPDTEWRAVASALDMRQRLEALNQRRIARGEKPIKSGIGISTGEAVAGQIGYLERLLYTVIGDAVNVAARLEGLTKEYAEYAILINAQTAAAIDDKIAARPGWALKPLGPLPVKGRTQPVEVYAIVEE